MCSATTCIFILLVCTGIRYFDGSEPVIQNIVQQTLVLNVYFLKFFKCLHTGTQSSHVTNENFSLASVFTSRNLKVTFLAATQFVYNSP